MILHDRKFPRMLDRAHPFSDILLFLRLRENNMIRFRFMFI